MLGAEPPRHLGWVCLINGEYCGNAAAVFYGCLACCFGGDFGR